MSVVKLDAISALRCAIADAVPELEGNICVGIGPQGHELTFPSLGIEATRFTYRSYQAEEMRTIANDSVVMDIGLHEVDIQLRLVASTSYERYALEQKVVDLFLSQPLRPGILVLPVSHCQLLDQFKATWILNSEDWEDARAFDQVYESIISITGEIPALATRAKAYTGRVLRFGLSHDFESDAPNPFVSSNTFEVVSVAQDGSVAPVT